MALEIRPLESGDLDELGRFLTAGFGAEADADFAAADVLRWKYLESMGDAQEPEPRSLIARDESARSSGTSASARSSSSSLPTAIASRRCT